MLIHNFYKKDRWVDSKGGVLNYRYREPEIFEPNKKYPLILFLHGSGGRGSDNEQQLWDANAIGAFAKQKVSSKFQSYIFAPQVPLNERWVSTEWDTDDYKLLPISSTMRKTFAALDSFIDNNEHVDTERVYVLGLSMGGWGTWDAITRRPNFFAAAVPICGGGDPSQAKDITEVNIWAWHGENDSVIDVYKSQQMVGAINSRNGNVRYTEIKGRGHDSWLDVWNNKELWEWLFSQRR